MVHRARFSAVLGVLTLATVALAPSASAAAPSALRTDVTADAAFIRSSATPSGAIAWYTDRRHVSPYLANYAAIGLAEAYQVTGTDADLKTAVSWLRWYAAHEDASGFVTDYDVSATGVETSTGDMDSTDAYAGTFLLAARAVSRAGGSSSVRSLGAAVTGAVSAIEATQDTDGLTWAKPAWHVKYLMDQAEAYAGLRAAVDLAAVVGLPTLATRAATDASRLSAGVATLWNPATGAYDWARHDDGAQAVTAWANLYSDSAEQAWAATFGLTDQSRSAALLHSLQTAHPQWDQPQATDVVNGSPATVGYWPVIGWGLLRAGDKAGASTAAAAIRGSAVAQNHAWPYTSGVAGQLVVLEAGNLSLVG
jgi:hypothetical protein